jgi:hypothetical protein
MTVPFPYHLAVTTLNNQPVRDPVDLEQRWQRHAARQVFPGEVYVHPHLYVTEFGRWYCNEKKVQPGANRLRTTVVHLNTESEVVYEFTV